jgi:Condensin II complex subunit CAP-H2 or CNDH2, N-terminal
VCIDAATLTLSDVLLRCATWCNACSLEDYLEELEHVNITLEGGESNLNFAEAALLIQGSTCIYSRKVEHLYALVLQTIEHLTNQNHAWNSSSNGKGGEEGGGSGDAAADADEVFLLLDDQIEEGHDIDLPPISDEHDAAAAGSRAGARRGGAPGSVSGIDRPPLFLLEQVRHSSAQHSLTLFVSSIKPL